ncbi:MAG: TRAP transporter substrate-binding protein DctP [Spirochaetaceae bacterium]|nr:TRAP transporter substrate-binding protein DctP [Spirochaetaceae bacterium]
MKRVLLFLIFLIVFNIDIFAQQIRIGTIAPAGSLWETTIREIAAEWTRISNGKITVRIFTGGAVGTEENIIRRMRIGTLDAAAITPYGMKNIADDLFILSTPMLIRDDDEFDYVLRRMKPTFNRILQENGYVALGWTNTGWVRWFSRSRVLYPDDLRRIRLAVDNNDYNAIQIWQRSGFRVIPLSFTDLISGINQGMADATYKTPYAASALGLIRHIPYMLDLPISPVYGLLLINERTWNRIDDRYKPEIMRRTSEIIARFYQEIARLDNEVMRQRNLNFVPLTPEALAEWEEVVGVAAERYARQTFSPQIYAEVRKYIDEYRNR